MEVQSCEKCRHKSHDVTLRQSEEVLCNSCWNGFPPYWPTYEYDQDQSDTEQEEDNEIDQSFKFTFSTPILLAVSNNNLPSKSGLQIMTTPAVKGRTKTTALRIGIAWI